MSIYRHVRAEGLIDSIKATYLSTVKYLYTLILTTPQARRKLKEQLSKSRIELKQKLITDKEDNIISLAKLTELPLNGHNGDELRQMFDELEKIHKADWESGKVRYARC